ncbi:MAG: DUF2062 domain-containing protein [Proteobacteria bacterium]|nr:DUF2062 domain-containing protein [Pseudomonadota bacterium]MBU1582145.1 DUF2062 domain-containing protein [Pseudomonadota bacterium]MBU2456221.1 DUF2062 domain-containing protein [Pseudomonadota bacterium]MBU2628642.1 DUF2062 domain-containing protein [Pseudomonadota bacterium]
MIITYAKRIYDRFLKIRGTPHEIGLGFALGLFIGFSPSMGIQIALAIFATSLLKWSKIAAVIGVQVTNPITAPFIYSFTYFLGSKLIGLEKPLEIKNLMTIESLLAMIQHAPRIFAAMTLGGILVGLPLAAIGYLVVYRMMTRYQEKLNARILNSTRKIRQRLKLYRLKRKKIKP